MEKLKSTLPNMVGVLTTVAVLCGGLLALVNNITQAPRDAAAEKALNTGIEQVIGGKCSVENKYEITRHINGKDQNFIVYETDKGTAIQSTDPNAFGGNLTVLVGFNDNGDILGYTILETAETPGLGAKVDTWFQKTENGGKGGKACIIGLNPQNANLTVSNDGGDVDAITASTITSRAFLRAIQQAYNTYMDKGTDASTGASKQEGN